MGDSATGQNGEDEAKEGRERCKWHGEPHAGLRNGRKKISASITGSSTGRSVVPRAIGAGLASVALLITPKEVRADADGNQHQYAHDNPRHTALEEVADGLLARVGAPVRLAIANPQQGRHDQGGEKE